MRRAIRSLLLGLGWASIWPCYLVLLAQAARLAPWPRNLGLLASTVLHGLALGVFIPAVLSWITRRDGWAERFLGVPVAVGRQLCRSGRFLAAAAVICLVPAYLLSAGEFAPEGRPITAPSFCRFFVLAFELSVWGTLLSLVRSGSPLMNWFDLDPVAEATVGDAPTLGSPPPSPITPSGSAPSSSRTTFPSPLCRLSRRRRELGWLSLAMAAGIIVLDARGFSFTARRLATGAAETLGLVVICWIVYRGLIGLIAHQSRRWIRPGRTWAKAISKAATLRVVTRSRIPEPPSPSTVEVASEDEASQMEELARRLGQLVSCGVLLAGVLGFAWVWELDAALIRFLANQPVWYGTDITLGDLTRCLALIVAGIVGWRSTSSVFAVTVFRRIPDDPGIRFAIVTLCRYILLALTTMLALGAIHVGTAQIGMVLAALGVGLGFGLQEIVSNFICGIILLLERPIRIGDVVTVAGTTGKVDCINIRATTIINGDNQSMIVPNREFITGNLVNWTHKDRILRVSIKVGVAYGSDPERIVDLLLAIAGDDPDVLRNPLPSALLEELGDSALKFVLHVFVPDPSLAGRVKHRLSAEVQRRFAEANIGIPYPTHEVHLCRVPDELTQVLDQPRWISGSTSSRIDPGTAAPPPPHLGDTLLPGHKYQPAVDLDEGVHRAVDD